MNVELGDIEAFLALAEELHFGKTARRLHVSPARVTQRIQSLERAVGGQLFERTSRTVRVTALGVQLRSGLESAYALMNETLEAARASARAPQGHVVIGFTATTAGEELNGIVRELDRTEPDVDVTLREVPSHDPLAALRDGSVDVLLHWLVFDQPDLTQGAAVGSYPMSALVAVGHPLAARAEVRFDDVAAYDVNDLPSFSAQLSRPFFPLVTSTGEPVRTRPVNTWQEALAAAARGATVHVTVDRMRERLGRDDVVMIPITDLPAMRLGLLWCTAAENERIRAVSAAAERWRRRESIARSLPTHTPAARAPKTTMQSC